MICLGWCAESGALAQVQNISYNGGVVTPLMQGVYLSRGSGYGFGCFAYLMGCLFAISMAIYVSPDVASEFEKRILATQFLVDPSIDHDKYGHADAKLITASELEAKKSAALAEA